jgi:DNA invertase Pin-like site-specific DNA recombinase
MYQVPGRIDETCHLLLIQYGGVQVDKVFTDKARGKDVKRPQLQAALDYVREGDVLVVHSMDRLAKSLDDLRKIVPGLSG